MFPALRDDGGDDEDAYDDDHHPLRPGGEALRQGKAKASDGEEREDGGPARLRVAGRRGMDDVTYGVADGVGDSLRSITGGLGDGARSHLPGAMNQVSSDMAAGFHLLSAIVEVSGPVVPAGGLTIRPFIPTHRGGVAQMVRATDS
jgi:hypothetical protein